MIFLSLRELCFPFLTEPFEYPGDSTGHPGCASKSRRGAVNERGRTRDETDSDGKIVNESSPIRQEKLRQGKRWAWRSETFSPVRSR